MLCTEETTRSAPVTGDDNDMPWSGFDGGPAAQKPIDTADYLHALTRVTECLADSGSVSGIVERALAIITEVVPGDLFLLTRIELDSLKAEYSISAHGDGRPVNADALVQTVKSMLSEQGQSAGPVTPESPCFLSVTAEEWRPETGLGQEINQVLLAASTVRGGWRDVLLVGRRTPIAVDSETEAFFCSVLRLVRLSTERQRCKMLESRGHEQVLRAKQEWQNSVDVLPQLICIVSVDGLVLRANRAIESLGLGTVTGITGSRFTQLLERLGVIDDLAQVGDNGEKLSEDDLAERRNRLWNLWWHGLKREPIKLGPLPSRDKRLYSLKLRRGCGVDINGDGEGDDSICVALLQDVTEREKSRSLIESYNETLQRQVEKQTLQLRRMNMELVKELIAHKQDKQALQLSEIKYLTLAENTLIGIYLLDKQRISFANSRLAAILGYSADELMELTLEQVFGPDYEQNAPVVASFLDHDGGALDGIEFSARRKDGTTVWLQLHQAQFSDGDNEILIGNVVDVTVRRNYEMGLMEERKRTRELSDRILVAQETERRRIARELHDGVGQKLGAIRMRLDQFAERNTDHENGAYREQLAEIGNRTKETLDEVRRVSMDLRPSLLDDLGISATLSWFVREFNLAAPHIEIRSDVGIDEENLSIVLKTQIFRIVQEAFNNVAKHAAATRIDLILGRRDSHLELHIRDNGRGLDGAENVEYAGLGLRSMLERAELSGGDLYVASRLQAGVSIRALWRHRD